MGIAKSFNSDRIFGITAFLISVGTFVIYIYEARLIQKQQYASVLPYLEMWNSSPRESTYKLILVNNGVGPAFIKDIRVHYKGKAYIGDHTDFYQTAIFPKDTIYSLTSNVRSGRVIPAGQTIELISIEGSQKDAEKMRNLFGNQTAKLEITYASVYEETWKLSGMENPPQKQDK
ncbi:hypothetical protein [Xanthocytophaga agilis]|uniref:Uncharacterized protein n=1 Tax=Xanthocytophaga agilis TaxID=3048010 RepID=A0AAE3R6K1_9BACT|nr:hypothetical protein [Xanthocytophaga agilis]MDJ1504821.1 hypothetical protein [Xanthocytophaga agilis]